MGTLKRNKQMFKGKLCVLFKDILKFENQNKLQSVSCFTWMNDTIIFLFVMYCKLREDPARTHAVLSTQGKVKPTGLGPESQNRLPLGTTAIFLKTQELGNLTEWEGGWILMF